MNESILVVDDDEDTATLLAEALRRCGYQADSISSGEACLERVRREPIDLVVTDAQMPGMSGVDLCGILHERHPDLLAIVLTGVGDLEMAIGAIRAGAYDFLIKPIKIEPLTVAVRRALEHLDLKREVKRLRGVGNAPIEQLIGNSAALRATTDMIRDVADTDATVLITGESGTGKELVGRALHDLSSRRNEPFVAINCAAMPASLLESELFGHVRGAFTDAKANRSGLFVQAAGGTIFLDEIGEMPLEMQVKLLRVLQERTVRPVGSDEEIPFSARVVTATNRDLQVEIEHKRFREDLFHRINVVAIPVPPLRARASDIVLLAKHVLERIAKRSSKPVATIDIEASRKLTEYDWPGNVRELENCLERAVAICIGGNITVGDLPDKVQQFQSSKFELSPTADAVELVSLDDMERRYVRQVLGRVGGNKTHAARILGIDRRSLYRRLESARPSEP
jgi:DNA-binding NtrC family response regulator